MKMRSWLMMQNTLVAPDRGVEVEMLGMGSPTDPTPGPVMALGVEPVAGVADSPPVVFVAPAVERVPVFARIDDLIGIIETPEVLARLNPVFAEPTVKPTFGESVRAWFAKGAQAIKAWGDRVVDLFQPQVPVAVYNERWVRHTEGAARGWF